MNTQLRQAAEFGNVPDSAFVELSALLELSGGWNGPGGLINLPQAQKDCLRRYAAHKARTDAYVRWVRQNITLRNGDAAFNPVKCQRLSDCGSILQFRQYPTLTPPKTVLSNSGACKQHLHCPICASRRAAKVVRNHYEKYKVLKKRNPKLRFYFAVLTIENGTDFMPTFDCLAKALRAMIANRRHGLKAIDGNKRCKYVAALESALLKVTAGAYSFEVKRGKRSGKWHPHVNLMLLCEGRLDYKKFREEWKRLTGDKGLMVYIKKKRFAKHQKDAFVEIFKYAMKFSEMEFCDTFQTATALYKRNLCGSFGDFRGLNVEKDDKLEYADLPYLLLIYRYNARRTCYSLDRIEAKVPSKQETWGSIIVNTAKALQDGGLQEC